MTANRHQTFRFARPPSRIFETLVPKLGPIQTQFAPLLCVGKIVTVDIAAGQSPMPGGDVVRGTSSNDTIDGRPGRSGYPWWLASRRGDDAVLFDGLA